MRVSFPRSFLRPLLAGTAATALVMGWAAGASAQNYVFVPQEQASAPATAPTTNLPPIPLGQNDVREVQNQLIALGYDPGPADGQIGPSTTAAVQQYDQKHGGNGGAPIDSALLARLKADPSPRLSYEQVAERSQHQQAQAQQASSSGANQFGGIVQQIVPLIGAAIANSNANNNNGYYNNGYYGPGPGYYGPGPGYYGPPPGYW